MLIEDININDDTCKRLRNLMFACGVLIVINLNCYVLTL